MRYCEGCIDMKDQKLADQQRLIDDLNRKANSLAWQSWLTGFLTFPVIMLVVYTFFYVSGTATYNAAVNETVKLETQ